MESEKKQGCLSALLRLFAGAEPEPASALPYRRKDYLLTKAERAFFEVLQGCAGGDFLIFAKVRLADLVWIPGGTESRMSFQNRIHSKHIDFVLCSRDAVRPVLAIELDDSSHERESRRARDEFVDATLNAAGLLFLRVPVRARYDAAELRTLIRSQTAEHSG